MLSVITVTTVASIVSGLILSSVMERIGDRIEKRRTLPHRLYAAQRAWAEATDMEEVNAIACLYIQNQDRAA